MGERATPEERARADFAAEAVELGESSQDAADYADAMMRTIYGQGLALHYALGDLGHSLSEPLLSIIRGDRR